MKNGALEKYRGEYQKSQKKLTLKKAITYCGERGVREPRWLHDALYALGRAQVGGKKTGRPSKLEFDRRIYATVEYYLDRWCTQSEAFARTAKDYTAELLPNRKREELGEIFTVKTIWLRHQKWLRERVIFWPNGKRGWNPVSPPDYSHLVKEKQRSL